MESIKITRMSIIFILPIFLITSCDKELKREEYLNYLYDENNGLNVSQSIGDLKFSSQLLTNDWYKIRENSESVFIEEDELHFIFTIQSLSGENPMNVSLSDSVTYYDRIAMLNRGIQNNFQIVQGGAEHQCVFAQVETNYDLSDKVNLTLVFEGVKKNEDFVLRFDDRIWYNGFIKLKYSKNELNNIPKLIFNKR